jgi:outer membrane protein OmpA-like peptidoglycan-associated protein
MPSMNPVDWWHNLEGGKIAEQRPPPPGATDAYPNLASVPAKPEPPDKEAMKKLTEALVADRANAHYTDQAAPLPDPSSPSASPGLFGVGTVPPPAPPTPPGPATASASMPAASAPPAPPPPPAAPETPAAPPSAAPRKAVQSAPLEAPASTQAPAAASTSQAATSPPAASPPAAAASSPQVVAAPAAPEPPQPPLPTQAPPPAAVVGAPPPPPPPAAPNPMPALGRAAANLEFVRGSAALSPETSAAVKQFAAGRGSATILVTGYGDAESSDPAAQTVALSLGLSRAQAVANALTADGVPTGSVRVNAEASGRGVALHLLQ